MDDPPKKNKTIREIFTDISQPIGLCLLGVFGYLEFGVGANVNDLYLVIIVLLLNGEKLIGKK